MTFDQLEGAYSSWQATGQLPHELLDDQDQLVQIRGFLYKTALGSEDAWILAAEPNLKSCCMGSSGKRGLQLIATGDLPESPPSTAVVLQGHLALSVEVQGPFYALSDASLKPSTYSLGSPAILILLLFFSIIGYGLRKIFSQSAQK